MPGAALHTAATASRAAVAMHALLIWQPLQAVELAQNALARTPHGHWRAPKAIQPDSEDYYYK